jgi:hypothetical protein
MGGERGDRRNRSRPRRGFRGPGGYREPAPLDEIVPGVLKGACRKASPGGLSKVRELWPGAVGEAAARRSRPLSLNDGELTIEVASAALRQHLSVFRRKEILEALRPAGVSSLRCKVSGRR